MNKDSMEDITINNSTYKLVRDYKGIDYLRKGFNELALECFDFDLESFYRKGYWDDRYIPYSLIVDNKIVANVSACNFDFTLNSERIKCVQIATVMTSKSYRKRGYSKFLIERVLLEWQNKSDLVYLFANDSAVEMYPKFGFIPKKEFVHSMRINKNSYTSDYLKIDMDKENDCRFVIDLIKESASFAKFASLNTLSLLIYFCTTLHKNNIYYLKKLDAIVVVEKKDNQLFLYDIFCKKFIEMNDIINSISTDGIDRIVFGITPIEARKYDEEELNIENSTLFILEDKKRIFNDRKIRFPALTRT